MRYQALLFCPDDKTARVVTQVLSELEFQVECCNEPFAAVKKLMAQHFDAIVVDCENEQNASLLFKSARNSGSNASALSVAVVEGDAPCCPRTVAQGGGGQACGHRARSVDADCRAQRRAAVHFSTVSHAIRAVPPSSNSHGKRFRF